MVVAVYQDKDWLILDNLTMLGKKRLRTYSCFGLHKRPPLFVGFLDGLRGRGPRPYVRRCHDRKRTTSRLV